MSLGACTVVTTGAIDSYTIGINNQDPSCITRVLPTDLLKLFFRAHEHNGTVKSRYLDLTTLFICRHVCRRIRTIVHSKLNVQVMKEEGKRFCAIVAERGNFNLVQWAHANGASGSADSALLDDIIADKEGMLSDALGLCSEEIIPSTRFFSVVLARVIASNEAVEQHGRLCALPKNSALEQVLEKHVRAIKGAVSLLNFCASWIRRNHGNASFTQASREIRALVTCCLEHKNPDVKALAPVLHNLAFVVPVRARKFNSIYTRPSEPKKHIETILQKMIKGSKEEKRQYANQIAQDLYSYHVEVFRAYDQRDLVKSHSGGEFGVSIKRNSDFSNALNYFVIETVLSTEKLSKRVKTIELFLLIARRAFELGDFMTATSIYGGLDGHWVSRLKRTWKEVDADYPELVRQKNDFLQLTFNNFTGLATKLRELQAQTGRSLPFLPSLLQKLDWSGDKEKFMIVNGTRYYNTTKIKKYLQFVKDNFAFQGNWSEVNKPLTANTSIVFTCLERMPKTQRDKEAKEVLFEQLSYGLEPRKLA